MDWLDVPNSKSGRPKLLIEYIGVSEILRTNTVDFWDLFSHQSMSKSSRPKLLIDYIGVSDILRTDKVDFRDWFFRLSDFEAFLWQFPIDVGNQRIIHKFVIPIGIECSADEKMWNELAFLIDNNHERTSPGMSELIPKFIIHIRISFSTKMIVVQIMNDFPPITVDNLLHTIVGCRVLRSLGVLMNSLREPLSGEPTH